MKILNVIVSVVALLAAVFGHKDSIAAPAGDPAYGKLIAETWCSSCHLVAADENRNVLADVPTFTDIARRLPNEADILAAFIADPHPPMPDLGLSRQDIRDVLGYIATLR